MERHKALAKGECDEAVAQILWKDFSTNLNALGDEPRSVEAWKRTWQDKVRLAKDKHSEIVKGVKKTSLNPLETRIVALFGLSIPTYKNQYDQIVIDDEPGCSSTNSSTLKRSLKCNEVPAKIPKLDNEDHVNIARQSNMIVSELSTTLIDCLQQQNVIIKEGFETLSLNINQLCQEIIAAFNLYREDENNYPVEYLEENSDE